MPRTLRSKHGPATSGASAGGTKGPPRAGGTEARRAEGRGALREALALARLATQAPRATPKERAEALLERARLAWRVGQAREATASLRTLRREARGPGSASLRLEASLLRATIALERGALTRARVALSAARATAEEAGDDEALARVLRRLGTLEARTGRPAVAAGAYRAALSALARVARPLDPALVPLLTANLATMESWRGHFDLARALYEEALAQRHDRPLETLNTRAALALLDASRGLRPPDGAFGPLVAEARRLGDPRLRAELASYRVEELVFAGRLADADEVLADARAASADLGGAELILDAMVEVVEGLLRARRGERGAGPTLVASVERLASRDARYHAARAARLAATALVWLGEDARAIGCIARAAELAEAGGFLLGDALPHVVALTLAGLRGDGVAQAHALEALDRLGPIRVEAALRREGRADLARAWVAQRLPQPQGALLRALGPEGTRALTTVERDALVAAGDSVVLDRAQRLLFVPGRAPRPLDRMRAIEPLLAHLVARSPEAVDVTELARVVWAQRPSRSVVGAITTSVARLRTLLGPAAPVRTRGEGLQRAYVLAPEARVWRIDAIGAVSARDTAL
jgi:hypothetical protein